MYEKGLNRGTFRQVDRYRQKEDRLENIDRETDRPVDKEDRKTDWK
jgi:hypothetical protein